MAAQTVIVYYSNAQDAIQYINGTPPPLATSESYILGSVNTGLSAFVAGYNKWNIAYTTGTATITGTYSTGDDISSIISGFSTGDVFSVYPSAKIIFYANSTNAGNFAAGAVPIATSDSSIPGGNNLLIGDIGTTKSWKVAYTSSNGSVTGSPTFYNGADLTTSIYGVQETYVVFAISSTAILYYSNAAHALAVADGSQPSPIAESTSYTLGNVTSGNSAFVGGYNLWNIAFVSGAGNVIGQLTDLSSTTSQPNLLTFIGSVFGDFVGAIFTVYPSATLVYYSSSTDSRNFITGAVPIATSGGTILGSSITFGDIGTTTEWCIGYTIPGGIVTSTDVYANATDLFMSTPNKEVYVVYPAAQPPPSGPLILYYSCYTDCANYVSVSSTPPIAQSDTYTLGNVTSGTSAFVGKYTSWKIGKITTHGSVDPLTPSRANGLDLATLFATYSVSQGDIFMVYPAASIIYFDNYSDASNYISGTTPIAISNTYSLGIISSGSVGSTTSWKIAYITPGNTILQSASSSYDNNTDLSTATLPNGIFLDVAAIIAVYPAVQTTTALILYYSCYTDCANYVSVSSTPPIAQSDTYTLGNVTSGTSAFVGNYTSWKIGNVTGYGAVTPPAQMHANNSDLSTLLATYSVSQGAIFLVYPAYGIVYFSNYSDANGYLTGNATPIAGGQYTLGTVSIGSGAITSYTSWKIAYVTGSGTIPLSVPSPVYSNGTDLLTTTSLPPSVTLIALGTVVAVYPAPAPTPVVCFLEGSNILCHVDGIDTYIPIETMKPGTLVVTSSHGYKKVELIGKEDIENPGHSERTLNRLYKCSPKNYPQLREDLYLTGCHSILVNSLTDLQRENMLKHLDKIHVTDNKYRLIACVDERAEPWQSEGRHTIWHFALENANERMNYGVYANGGLLVETCSINCMKNKSNLTMIS